MRPPRKILLLGLLTVMAAVCWKKCCVPHLRRWRNARAAGAAGASSVRGQPHGYCGCCAALVGALLSIVMLAVPALAAGPASSVKLAVETLPTGAVRVTATVTDAREAPMPDVSVVVRAKTTFGWLKVAEGATDPRGQIRAELPAPSRFEEITVEAGDANTVQAAVRLEQGQPAAPAMRPGYDRLARLSPQPGFISPYPVPLQVLLLGVILGGIWATYGYIVSQLVQIRRAR